MPKQRRATDTQSSQRSSPISPQRPDVSQMSKEELLVWIRMTHAALQKKMARERAYLDRRALRGTRTPTDEAYEADVRRIGGGERVQQRLLELMEGSMHTPLTLTLERGRRPEHVGKAA
jgi:hypothetical protein